jgi:hypothetical protein
MKSDIYGETIPGKDPGAVCGVRRYILCKRAESAGGNKNALKNVQGLPEDEGEGVRFRAKIKGKWVPAEEVQILGTEEEIREFASTLIAAYSPHRAG